MVRPAQKNLYDVPLQNEFLLKTRKRNLISEKLFMVNNLVSVKLLLKVLVRESPLDTNATTSWIYTQLLVLDEYMLTVVSDIGKFNLHVQNLVGSLQAQVETSNDLITNLFKDYAACSVTIQKKVRRH